MHVKSVSMPWQQEEGIKNAMSRRLTRQKTKPSKKDSRGSVLLGFESNKDGSMNYGGTKAADRFDS